MCFLLCVQERSDQGGGVQLLELGRIHVKFGHYIFKIR